MAFQCQCQAMSSVASQDAATQVRRGNADLRATKLVGGQVMSLQRRKIRPNATVPQQAKGGRWKETCIDSNSSESGPGATVTMGMVLQRTQVKRDTIVC